MTEVTSKQRSKKKPKSRWDRMWETRRKKYGPSGERPIRKVTTK